MGTKVLLKGNEAIAEAAMRCGCRYFFGYPITPQSEIASYMAKHLPARGGVFLQAESEISAINMVYGAAGSGARTMTGSSSPGISLKMEGISYIAAADIPCVIANIQRGGPGLGGIQPSQQDYYQAVKGGGHGDYHTLVYAPWSVQEMMDLTVLSFDKSDEYRVPAMLMADGTLGQMMEPAEPPPFQDPPNPADKAYATVGTEGGRGKNIINSLYLDPHKLEEVIRERYARYDIIKEKEQLCETMYTDDAEVVVAAYGSAARIVATAISSLREKGVKVGLIRPITLWPFPQKAFDTLTAKVILTVELNMGQMLDDVRLAVGGRIPVEFYGRPGGVVPGAAEIADQIMKLV
ncbi:MAG: 3-methyl-2-oxobutanoate dehydrogenase subunit VorB [Oscillospiraceae bacterium]|nr:3-methyl-2-oxobutanoate dehydrogenase subunit VorB [Oscillospiraceae bacterium]